MMVLPHAGFKPKRRARYPCFRFFGFLGLRLSKSERAAPVS
jgi:hypothetical protein